MNNKLLFTPTQEGLSDRSINACLSQLLQQIYLVYFTKCCWICLNYKTLSFSLSDFVILYWLNIKKIEVALSETKTFIAALKFQYRYLRFGVLFIAKLSDYMKYIFSWTLKRTVINIWIIET